MVAPFAVAAVLVSSAVSVLAPSAAHAAPAKRLAIVTPPEGADFVPAIAVAVAADGFTVVPAAEVDAALAELDLASSPGRFASDARAFATLVRRLALAAVVTLDISRPEPTRLAAHIVLRGRRGQTLRTWDWTRSTPIPVAAPLASPPTPPSPPAAGPLPAASTSAPAPGAPPDAAASPPGVVADSPPAPPPTVQPTLPPVPPPASPLLHASIGPRLLTRSLSYDSDPAGLLPDFRTRAPTLGLGVGLRVHPFGGGARPLGFAFAAEVGQAIRTITDAGLYLSSNDDVRLTFAWALSGPRWRVAFGLGAGQQRFTYRLVGAHITHPQPFPDVTYRYLRAGAEGQYAATTRLTILAHLHHRTVFSAGSLTAANWFPGASVWGLDGAFGVDFRIRPWLSAALAYQLCRYHLDFSRARSVRDAAGAVDLYQALSLYMNVAFGARS
jgi:hypothetical protein